MGYRKQQQQQQWCHTYCAEFELHQNCFENISEYSPSIHLNKDNLICSIPEFFYCIFEIGNEIYFNIINSCSVPSMYRHRVECVNVERSLSSQLVMLCLLSIRNIYIDQSLWWAFVYTKFWAEFWEKLFVRMKIVNRNGLYNMRSKTQIQNPWFHQITASKFQYHAYFICLACIVSFILVKNVMNRNGMIAKIFSMK